MRRSKATRPVAAMSALVAVLVLHACGGDDSAEDADNDLTDAVSQTTGSGDSGSGDSESEEGRLSSENSEVPSEATSDADSDSGSEGSPAETCPSQDQTTLTFDTGSPVTGLDPTQVFGAATTGGIQGTALFDTLLRYDPSRDDYVPHLAESYERTGDLEWTVVLREGLTYPSGRPLTAADLAANHERMASAVVSSSLLAGLIGEVEVVDDRTAIYHLSEPWGEFPYYLAEEGGMILDVEVADERGPEAFNVDPSGAGVGPYDVERFTPGEELIFRAKDDYWGGEVCIDEIRFVALGSPNTAVDAMLSGEVDAAFMTDPNVAASAEEDGLAVTEVISGAGDLLLLNQGAHGVSGPTDDVTVRQAIVAALDVDVLNDRAYEGNALATKALTWESQAVHPDTAGPAYDPDLARDLVAEAMDNGWDGKVELLCNNDPAAVEQSIAAESMLEAVGMDVTLETVTSPAIFERIAGQGRYQIGCWGGNIPDPSPWATVLAQYASDAPSNRVGLNSPEMDDALLDLRQAENASERQAALGTVQEVWNEVAPAAILTAQTWFIAAQEDVENVVMTRDAIPMFHDAYLAS